MTPLQDRWSGQSRPGWRVIAGPQFGGSSRGPSWGRPWGVRRRAARRSVRPPTGAYRTVCVRLCDGYYFPINFAVTRDKLQRDSGVCASRCGAQGRLFVHRNPGGSVEDMEDLSGRPYRQLRTAFLYRTELVANCKCQPDPWDEAAQNRHRAYALAQEARKGSKTAAKELQTLQDKMRQTAMRRPSRRLPERWQPARLRLPPRRRSPVATTAASCGSAAARPQGEAGRQAHAHGAPTGPRLDRRAFNPPSGG